MQSDGQPSNQDSRKYPTFDVPTNTFEMIQNSSLAVLQALLDVNNVINETRGGELAEEGIKRLQTTADRGVYKDCQGEYKPETKINLADGWIDLMKASSFLCDL